MLCHANKFITDMPNLCALNFSTDISKNYVARYFTHNLSLRQFVTIDSNVKQKFSLKKKLLCKVILAENTTVSLISKCIYAVICVTP